MKKRFAPNITRRGRVVRALFALGLLVGGFLALNHSIWLAVAFFIAAGFVFFEAARGWCVMRACGFKTPM